MNIDIKIERYRYFQKIWVNTQIVIVVYAHLQVQFVCITVSVTDFTLSEDPVQCMCVRICGAEKSLVSILSLLCFFLCWK